MKTQDLADLNFLWNLVDSGLTVCYTYDMDKAHYIVKNAHTLGFIVSEMEMQILAGNPLLGGHNWMDGTAAYLKSDIRPATRADFKKFRVVVPPNFA